MLQLPSRVTDQHEQTRAKEGDRGWFKMKNGMHTKPYVDDPAVTDESLEMGSIVSSQARTNMHYS